jgi:hypothetical protein
MAATELLVGSSSGAVWHRILAGVSGEVCWAPRVLFVARPLGLPPRDHFRVANCPGNRSH